MSAPSKYTKNQRTLYINSSAWDDLGLLARMANCSRSKLVTKLITTNAGFRRQAIESFRRDSESASRRSV